MAWDRCPTSEFVVSIGCLPVVRRLELVAVNKLSARKIRFVQISAVKKGFEQIGAIKMSTSKVCFA